MSWNQRGRNQEQRVSNPFGGPAPAQQTPFGGSAHVQQNPFGQAPTGGFGTFGQSGFGVFGQQHNASQSNPFQQPQRLNSGNFPSKGGKGGKGKGKGKGHQPQSSNSQMFDEIPTSPQIRVTNPFAAVGATPKHNLSAEDAANQYKMECVKKKGYPFSCFGLPDELPMLKGDISPAELRWYLSQNNVDIQRAISDRSSLLNEDFSDFLRGATAEGAAPILIKRAGPYRIPDPDFPNFVPRQTFLVIPSPAATPSEADMEMFKARSFPTGSPIPSIPPPLELR